jgi:hypothetical protein
MMGPLKVLNLHLEEMDLHLNLNLKFDLNVGYYGEIQRMHTAKGNLSAVISKDRAYATAPG